MVLGQPFSVEGITYTPADALNYDRVGYAAIGQAGGNAVSLSNRTLPLPSYVEVTSLKTGKTILARVERRGPMAGTNLIEFSPGAAAQLGAQSDLTPVRIRRVNPPETERALLRAGQRAPERMETPISLVNVLLRKLEPGTISVVAATEPAKLPPLMASTKDLPPSKPPATAKPDVNKAEPKPSPKPRGIMPALAKSLRNRPLQPKVTTSSSTVPAAQSVAPKRHFAIQVGTFSSAANATAAAKKVGGSVAASGKLFRVRITGFAIASDAQGALAKAKGAGYTDARIQRAD